MVGGPGEAPTSRRDVLAATATVAAAASGGCVRRLRSVAGWRSAGQVTLRIKTIPPDDDPYASGIARAFSEWLDAAGIDARVVLESEEELFRSVLVNREFDVFVARTARDYRSPDQLYSLLHSTFAAAPGWQNPFGHADLDVDELLERQRRVDGSTRRDAVVELQRTIAETQPFTVVCFPDDIRAGRNDRYANWRTADLDSPTGYLTLKQRSEVDAETLRVVTTDGRVTENLNPLAVEFRGRGTVTGLLYDPLVRGGERAVEPWLAESLTTRWGNEERAARIRLREDLHWHDGAPLTAEDVAFTFAFLADTTMGEAEDPMPAPRYQGRIDLVEDARAVDRRTVEIEFAEATRPVALSVLTVPVLPAHVWRDRTAPASVSGIEVGDGVTEAIVSANLPPVGSGPFEFAEANEGESLVLDRFDDHFVHRDGAGGIARAYHGGAAFERLVLRVVGSDVTAADLVANGELDATASALGADTVPRIGREDRLDLVVDRSNSFYLLGYNARRSPLSHPRVRNILGHLIDKAAIVDDVFEGYAGPAASPLHRTEWLPPDLEWDGSDPATPFFGSDGHLDATRARDAFREAGYRYQDGELQRR